MSEEEQVVVETPVVESVQHSVVEERAMSQGWKPKEQYVADGGNESDWRPAKEFVDRGELFSKIEEGKREIRNLRKTMQLFREHHEKVRQTEYQRALDDLKVAKKAALIDGDADRVIEIDQQILDTREAQKQAVMVQAAEDVAAPAINPAFSAWVERNQWYSYDTEMKAFADQFGTSYAQQNPGLTIERVLKEVETRVKKAYSEKFTNPRKQDAPDVEAGGKAPRSSRSNAGIELTEDEQRAMRRFVKAGAMTEEQYIAEVKAMRGIK